MQSLRGYGASSRRRLYSKPNMNINCTTQSRILLRGSLRGKQRVLPQSTYYSLNLAMLQIRQKWWIFLNNIDGIENPSECLLGGLLLGFWEGLFTAGATFNHLLMQPGRTLQSTIYVLTYTVNNTNTDMPPILPILLILVHSQYKMPVGHSDALDIFSHSHITLRS